MNDLAETDIADNEHYFRKRFLQQLPKTSPLCAINITQVAAKGLTILVSTYKNTIQMSETRMSLRLQSNKVMPTQLFSVNTKTTCACDKRCYY